MKCRMLPLYNLECDDCEMCIKIYEIKKKKISCREFIKKYGENIDAFTNSLSHIILDNYNINGLLAFMRHQGLLIYLENNEMYIYGE